MDDKIKGIVVTLEDGVNEECREELVDAIRMLRGVQDVSTVSGDNSFHESLIVRKTCSEIRLKLEKVFWEINEIKP